MQKLIKTLSVHFQNKSALSVQDQWSTVQYPPPTHTHTQTHTHTHTHTHTPHCPQRLSLQPKVGGVEKKEEENKKSI